tara:strand:+ start:524 stop:1087 length:564 start_codon:yes stop_codon:yes gene_type:complete
MSSIQVIFIRHAEASNSWGNHPDPGLSDNGKNQSKELINHPELIELDDYSFISSPKLRAIETAKPLSEKFKKELIIENIFTEIPSLNIEPDKKQEWLKNILQMNKNDLPENITKWKDNIISKTKAFSQDSVVFTHFIVINALLSELNSETKLLYFYPDYTSIVKITIEDGEFRNFSIDKDKKTFINL